MLPGISRLFVIAIILQLQFRGRDRHSSRYDVVRGTWYVVRGRFSISSFIKIDLLTVTPGDFRGDSLSVNQLLVPEQATSSVKSVVR
jgi:hypothetical protein